MANHELVMSYQFFKATMAADSALTSDAPGGIWQALAPAGTLPVWVIMQHQASRDMLTFNVNRIMDSLLFAIKAVGPMKSFSAVAVAAADIDRLFKKTSGAVSGGAILACWRESSFDLPELVSGDLWISLVGMYRLEVTQV